MSEQVATIEPAATPVLLETRHLKHGTRRMCVCCGEPSEKENFHIRRHSLTGNLYFDSHCKPCRKRKNAEKKRRAKERKQQEEFRAAVRKMRGDSIKAPHVSELWAELVAEYGGLAKFVKEYKAQIDSAVQQKPGSKTVLDAFKQIAHLSVHSSSLRGSAPDMANLTDEDLEQQLKVMTMRVLKNTPKMLQDMIESGSISVPSVTVPVEYADPHADQPEVARAPTV